MSVRIEKAFILAAGLGTRLRPLTRVLPKPLLPLAGRPLLDFAWQHLRRCGVSRFALNGHHLAPALDAHAQRHRAAGLDVQFFYEPALLGTGGALINAREWMADDPVLVHSGDVVTDLDLNALVDAHCRDGSAVTLALRDTGFTPEVAYDPGTQRVLDLRGALGRPSPAVHDYANVMVLNGGALRSCAPGPRPLAAVLVDLLQRGERVGGVLLNGGGWFNLGSRDEYVALHRLLLDGRWRPAFAAQPWWRPEEVSATGDYALTGATWVAAEAKIEPGAALHDTIVWARSRVLAGARLDACVVAGKTAGPGVFSGVDFCA
ncbi:MAG: NTP transferase domain-containing protein [Verrucomicrobia bacterium]|nr:NTP transferase domain-containing protein [Verrucomicrobiota bacterium]